MDDLESFFRRLCLKEFFIHVDEEEEEENDVDILFPPSTWMPPKCRDTALETYIRKVRTDVEHQLNRQVKIPCNNLPSAERTVLKNL